MLFYFDMVCISKKRKLQMYLGFIYQILIFFLGWFYTSSFYHTTSDPGIDTNHEHIWKGEVLAVYQKENSKTVEVQLLSIMKKDRSESESKIMLYTSKSMKVQPGDRFIAKSYFNSFKSPLNPGQFDYKGFYENRNFYYYVFEDDLLVYDHNRGIRNFVSNIQVNLEKAYKDIGIVGDELAVLKALIIGDRSSVNPELKSKFSESGAMHVLAVSGLHIGIVFLILNQALKFLGQQKVQSWLKAIIILIGIWGFALISGLSPSAQRASWMFSFIVLSKALNRNTNVINTIAASALLLFLINPKILFEVGFQLSYSAVLGIVIIHPKLYSLFKTRNVWLNKIISLSLVSFTAQLATLPLTLYYFHQFPNLFLLTNLFVIPLVFAVVIGAFIVSMLWLIFEHDFYLGTLLDLMIGLLNYLVESISTIPNSTTSGIQILDINLLLIYAAIGAFSMYLYSLKRMMIKVTVLIVCFIYSLELLDDVSYLKQKSICFYALSHDAISIVSGLESEIFIDADSINYYDSVTIENHLRSIGVRKRNFYLKNSDRIKGNLFTYRRDSRQRQLLAFNCKVNFLDPETYQSSIDANIIIFSERVQPKSILNIGGVEDKTLLFSCKVQEWSNLYQEYVDNNSIKFLSREGYYQKSF